MEQKNACSSSTGCAAVAARALLRHGVMSFGAGLWWPYASYSESHRRFSEKLSARNSVDSLRGPDGVFLPALVYVRSNRSFGAMPCTNL